MEKPLAMNNTVVRRLGPNGVEHDVIRMQAEEHVRSDGIVIDAMKVFGWQVSYRLSTDASAIRQAVRAFDGHVSTDKRTGDQIILSRCGWADSCQLRVDGRAVITLVVILEDELPIGFDIIDNAPLRLKGGQIPTIEFIQDGSEDLLEGLGRFGKIEKDKAFPYSQVDHM